MNVAWKSGEINIRHRSDKLCKKPTGSKLFISQLAQNKLLRLWVHFLQENTKSIEILILTEKSLWCSTEDQMFLISHECVIKALTTDLRKETYRLSCLSCHWQLTCGPLTQKGNSLVTISLAKLSLAWKQTKREFNLIRGSVLDSCFSW